MDRNDIVDYVNNTPGNTNPTVLGQMIDALGTGGGWPADLPKPSVGGYGYTEQGEQTVITWDGNTEGKTVVAGRYCKVADNCFNNEDIVGMNVTTSTGESTAVTQEMYDDMLEHGFLAEDFAFLGDDVLCVRKPNIDVFSLHFDETGVYFIKREEYITSLTYRGNTIHKIDEKYLPASGGTMVVVPCTINPETMDVELTDTGVAVMDKINTDYQNGNIYPVICKISPELGDSSLDLYINLCALGFEDGSVVLSFASNDVRGDSFVSNVAKIGKISDEWTVQFLTTSIPLDH